MGLSTNVNSNNYINKTCRECNRIKDKVIALIREREWDKQKIPTKISQEMTDHILGCIKTPRIDHINNISWWMSKS